MGQRNSTLFVLISATLALPCALLFAQMGGSDVPPASMEGVTAPIVDRKTGNYTAILYAKGAKVNGYTLRDVRLDIIKSKVLDPKKISDISNLPIYPFGTRDSALVNRFWDSVSHSQAIIESEEVELKPTEKILSGEKKVHVYAREADVSGRGFSYEMDSKRLEINNEVRIIIRSTEGGNLDYASPQKTKNHKK